MSEPRADEFDATARWVRANREDIALVTTWLFRNPLFYNNLLTIARMDHRLETAHHRGVVPVNSSQEFDFE